MARTSGPRDGGQLRLDHVTAGNFAWSMTTARYRYGAEDVYPSLRVAHSKNQDSSSTRNLGRPISVNAAGLAESIDPILKDRRYLDFTIQEPKTPQTATLIIDDQPDSGPDEPEFKEAQITHHTTLRQYEEVYPPDLAKSEALQLTPPQIILQPYQYIDMMPSKGIRNAVIDALEIWYHVPEDSLAVIREIVNTLHSSSLM